jgi:hypothetical protein
LEEICNGVCSKKYTGAQSQGYPGKIQTALERFCRDFEQIAYLADTQYSQNAIAYSGLSKVVINFFRYAQMEIVMWLNILIALAAIVTVTVSYLRVKEIVMTVKGDSEGKSSDRCDAG